MWIISRAGFVSVVQHDSDADLMRVRARRRDHLVDTLGLDDFDTVIDLGEDAPDYRYHVNVSRQRVAEAMVAAVYDVNYTSHVKESIAGSDDEMYLAMLKCWRALYELQPRE